jgi:thiosulfate/3-mercaptopyruvate sulfurtransferase
MQDDPKTLVSTEWLHAHLKDPDLRILDGSYYLPQMGRDPRAEYDAAHVPNARFFDIDDVADHGSDLPHMVPPVEKFMSRMRAMGVGDGHQVVVYDGMGLFSAARVWWLFKLMGQNNIAVLDGGLPKWQAEGRPVEDLPPVIRDRHMTVRRQNHMVKDVTQVSAASKLGDYEIIDARSPGRFRGEEPGTTRRIAPRSYPRIKKRLFQGPVERRSNNEKPLWKFARFSKPAGVDFNKPAITTCGSGVTAAVLSLGLERIGKTDHSLYDGSWSEWGMFPTVPVATGDA